MSAKGRPLSLYKKEVEKVCNDSKAVAAAKNELSTMDVLVCGICHEVFHLIYEFHEHKITDCSNKTAESVSNTSAKLWAFMLWKNSAKSKQIYPDTSNNLLMWRNWAKMDETKRQTWITAGSVFWEIAGIKNSGINEISAEATGKAAKEKEKQVSVVPISSLLSNANLNPTISLERVSLTSKEGGLKDSGSKYVNKRPHSTEVPDNTLSKKAKNQEAPEEECNEYVVEAVVGKRFHKASQSYQYEIKWEGFPSSENTWEPETNLTHCTAMIAEYEVKKRTDANNIGGKPVRSSKAKAFDNLKYWTGTGAQTTLDPDIEIKIEQNDDDMDIDFTPDNDGYNAPSSGDEEYTEPEPVKKPVKSKPSPVKITKPQKAKTATKVLPSIIKQIAIQKTPVKVVDPKTSTLLVANSLGMVRVNAKALPNVRPGIYSIERQEQLKRIKPLMPKTTFDSPSTGLVVITTNPGKETPGVRMKPRQPLQHLSHNKTPAKPPIYTTPATSKSKAPIIVKNTFQGLKESPNVSKQTFILPPNPSSLPYLVMGTPGSGIGALLITPAPDVSTNTTNISKVDVQKQSKNESKQSVKESDKTAENEISLSMNVTEEDDRDMEDNTNIEESTPEPKKKITTTAAEDKTTTAEDKTTTAEDKTTTAEDKTTTADDKCTTAENKTAENKTATAEDKRTANESEEKSSKIIENPFEEGDLLLSELENISGGTLLPEKPEEDSLLAETDKSESSKAVDKSCKEESLKVPDASTTSPKKTQIAISPTKLAVSPTKSDIDNQDGPVLMGPQLVTIPPGVDPTLIELPSNTQLMVSEAGEYYLVPIQPEGSSLALSQDSSGEVKVVNLESSNEPGDSSQTAPNEEENDADKFVVVLPDGQLILVSDNPTSESVQDASI